MSKPGGSRDTVPCNICGKEYAPKLLDYHQSRCSANTGLAAAKGMSSGAGGGSVFSKAAGSSLK